MLGKFSHNKWDSKPKNLATLTVEENRDWEEYFAWYLNMAGQKPKRGRAEQPGSTLHRGHLPGKIADANS